ncbi:MAG: TSUP family transporter [Candidatus Omnitrophica bacterium]|nr:TSUP family transporter [Candidatus Omnitrophota bacterium]MBD3268743.1 TSUP family transporter [Candidatus Omnitrophota bacterium]
MLPYLILGLIAGLLSGILGLGGGAVIIPALVYLFSFSQHQAQGTTLAMMVPPIGLLAALEYYRQGNVKIGIALILCIGFIAGSFYGARLVEKIPDVLLKKIFGVFLLAVSFRMIFGK